jgi:O-antigen/teichoic acid export membrane protein
VADPPRASPAPAGRKSLHGGAWLGLAKLWFLVAGYALNVALTHLVSESLYGQYQTLARAVAVPNMVIIYTIMFAVSRPLSSQLEDGCPAYAAVRRKGFRLALGLGAVATAITLALAPALAAWWDDPTLVGPLCVVAPISFVYALYAVNVGTLNGTRRFSRQAALDITMATLKAAFMAGAAVLALGLPAIVGGFTLAAAAALALSFVLVAGARPAGGARDTGASAPAMAGFAAALILFTAALNLLQSVDLLVLSSFSETALRKDAVGYYSSAQLVALVPYSLMNAAALVAFPFVAALAGRGSRRDREWDEHARGYVRATATTTLTLLCCMSAIVAAAAPEVQRLLFPGAYAAGASHLRLLVLGYSGYSFANTVAWICNSAGHRRAALVLVGLPLATVVPLSLLLCPAQHAQGAAIAVASAGVLAVVGALVVLRVVFGVRLPWVHLLKLALAVGAVLGLGYALQVPTAGLLGKLAILGKLGALAMAFVAVVMATRAVTVTQLRELRRG